MKNYYTQLGQPAFFSHVSKGVLYVPVTKNPLKGSHAENTFVYLSSQNDFSNLLVDNSPPFSQQLNSKVQEYHPVLYPTQHNTILNN